MSKIALVTGVAAKHSMGRACAMQLASEGCDVILVDKFMIPPTIREEDADWQGMKQIIADIEALGQKAVAIEADLGSTEDCLRVVEERNQIVLHEDVQRELKFLHLRVKIIRRRNIFLVIFGHVSMAAWQNTSITVFADVHCCSVVKQRFAGKTAIIIDAPRILRFYSPMISSLKRKRFVVSYL